MRLTKAWLKNQSELLQKRINDILRMSDAEVDKEHLAVFPTMKDGERPVFIHAKQSQIINYAFYQHFDRHTF